MDEERRERLERIAGAAKELMYPSDNTLYVVRQIALCQALNELGDAIPDRPLVVTTPSGKRYLQLEIPIKI